MSPAPLMENAEWELRYDLNWRVVKFCCVWVGNDKEWKRVRVFQCVWGCNPWDTPDAWTSAVPVHRWTAASRRLVASTLEACLLRRFCHWQPYLSIMFPVYFCWEPRSRGENRRDLESLDEATQQPRTSQASFIQNKPQTLAKQHSTYNKASRNVRQVGPPWLNMYF